MNARNLIGREVTILVEEDTADALNRVLGSLGMDLVDDDGDSPAAALPTPARRATTGRTSVDEARTRDAAEAARAHKANVAFFGGSPSDEDRDARARAANDAFFGAMGVASGGG